MLEDKTLSQRQLNSPVLDPSQYFPEPEKNARASAVKIEPWSGMQMLKQWRQLCYCCFENQRKWLNRINPVNGKSKWHTVTLLYAIFFLITCSWSNCKRFTVLFLFFLIFIFNPSLFQTTFHYPIDSQIKIKINKINLTLQFFLLNILFHSEINQTMKVKWVHVDSKNCFTWGCLLNLCRTIGPGRAGRPFSPSSPRSPLVPLHPSFPGSPGRPPGPGWPWKMTNIRWYMSI